MLITEKAKLFDQKAREGVETMKTNVQIFFNGAVMDYTFDVSKEEFIEHWENHMAGQGYFTGIDNKGRHVNISPTQCPVIEITEASK